TIVTVSLLLYNDMTKPTHFPYLFCSPKISSSPSILKAAFHMIVHHAGRLHVRVADRGADELEATLLQVLGQGVRLQRRRPHGFSSHPIGVAQCPVAHKAPDVPVEAAELLLDFQEAPCVGNGAFH